MLPSFPSPPHGATEHSHHLSTSQIPRPSEPHHNRIPSPRSVDFDSLDGGPIRNYPRTPQGRSLPPLRYITSFDDSSPTRDLPPNSAFYPSSHGQYSQTPPHTIESHHPRLPNYPPTPVGGKRTMLERACLKTYTDITRYSCYLFAEAWHVTMTTDPLEDSDDEMDENTRLDLRAF